MLAYVFWHWPMPAVDDADYEDRQRAFHQALAAEPPPGFLGSVITAVRGLPWAAGGDSAYEDWYLVEDFASLGELNQAAVSRSRSVPHDAAAAVAAGGAAGLYALVAGAPVTRPTEARWFAKPPGMGYADLAAEIGVPAAEGGAALWMRQMVLGPGPEFCLHGSAPPAFPGRLRPLMVDMRPVHSSLAGMHG